MGAPYAGWIEFGGTPRPRKYVADGRYLGPSYENSDEAIANGAEHEIERIT